MKFLKSFIIVSALSVFGLVQVTFVMFGGFYFSNYFESEYPTFSKIVYDFSPMIGFMTLIYPFYVVIALKDFPHSPA